MGWASGGEVFDPVARVLVDRHVQSPVITDALTVLIEKLQDRGWDTEGESLGEFGEHSAVVDAFARRGIYRDDDPRHEDYLAFREEHRELYPRGCAVKGCGFCVGREVTTPRGGFPREMRYGGVDEE